MAGNILFYVAFEGGAALVRAESREDAERWVEEHFGEVLAPFKVREATEDDLDHVARIGGEIYQA